MKRTLYVLFVAVLLCAMPAFMNKAAAQEEQVTICHVPPGNPDNPQTITIGASAVPHHLANHEGDFIGACDDHI